MKEQKKINVLESLEMPDQQKEIPLWKESKGQKKLELLLNAEYRYSPFMAVSIFITFIKRISEDDIVYLEKYSKDFYYLSNEMDFRKMLNEGEDLSDIFLKLWDSDIFSDLTKRIIIQRAYLFFNIKF